MHSLQITANSCAGEGPPINMSHIQHGKICFLPSITIIKFHAVGCGIPYLLDTSVSQSNYTDIWKFSTHEGSKLKFICDNEKLIIVTCTCNGSWSPDQRDISCSSLKLFTEVSFSDSAYCEAPVLPAHSHIYEAISVPGLVLIYQCDSGYEPSQLLVSKCLSSGDCSKIVTALDCTLQGLINAIVCFIFLT